MPVHLLLLCLPWLCVIVCYNPYLPWCHAIRKSAGIFFPAGISASVYLDGCGSKKCSVNLMHYRILKDILAVCAGII